MDYDNHNQDFRISWQGLKMKFAPIFNNFAISIESDKQVFRFNKQKSLEFPTFFIGNIKWKLI